MKVWVYRNLKHGRKAPPLYSLMRRGKVIARRRRVLLTDVRFVVRKGGRARVLQSGHKNVHAFAVGTLAGSKGAFGTWAGSGKDFPVKITYNPHKADFFSTVEGSKVNGARGVMLNANGISACYLE